MLQLPKMPKQRVWVPLLFGLIFVGISFKCILLGAEGAPNNINGAGFACFVAAVGFGITACVQACKEG